MKYRCLACGKTTEDRDDCDVLPKDNERCSHEWEPMDAKLQTASDAEWRAYYENKCRQQRNEIEALQRQVEELRDLLAASNRVVSIDELSDSLDDLKFGDDRENTPDNR